MTIELTQEEKQKFEEIKFDYFTHKGNTLSSPINEQREIKTLMSLAKYMVEKKIDMSINTFLRDVAVINIGSYDEDQSEIIISRFEKNLPSYQAKQKAISFVDELTNRNQEIDPYLLLKNAYSIATKDGFFDKEMFKECMRGMFFGNVMGGYSSFLIEFNNDLNTLADQVEKDGISPRAGKLYHNLIKVVTTIITATFASLSGANPLLVAGLAVSGGVIGHFISKFNTERLNTTQVDKAMDKLLKDLQTNLPVDKDFNYAEPRVNDAKERATKVVESLKPGNTFALRTEAERAASVNSKKER